MGAAHLLSHLLASMHLSMQLTRAQKASVSGALTASLLATAHLEASWAVRDELPKQLAAEAQALKSKHLSALVLHSPWQVSGRQDASQWHWAFAVHVPSLLRERQEEFVDRQPIPVS